MTVQNKNGLVTLQQRGLAILQEKAAGVPTVSHARRVPIWLPDGTEAKTAEQIAVATCNFDDLELKVVRHVRTAAGVRKYGQPIGSIIVADGIAPLRHLKDTGDSEFYGWSKAKGSDGNDYYIGKDDTTGSWVATNGDDWDNLVVDGAKSEEEALRLLDHAVNTRHASRTKAKAPIRGAKHPQGPGKEHRDVVGGQIRQADNKPTTSKVSAPQENHAGEAADMSDTELIAAIKKERSQTSARALALNNEQVRRNNKKIKRTDLSNRERNDYEGLDKDGKATYIQSRNEGQSHAVAMSQASRNSSYLEEDKPGKKPATFANGETSADRGKRRAAPAKDLSEEDLKREIADLERMAGKTPKLQTRYSEVTKEWNKRARSKNRSALSAVAPGLNTGDSVTLGEARRGSLVYSVVSQSGDRVTVEDSNGTRKTYAKDRLKKVGGSNKPPAEIPTAQSSGGNREPDNRHVFDSKKVYVHAADWDGPVSTDDGYVIWNASRPLNGEKMWEGQYRRGIHYAAGKPGDESFDRWTQMNTANDGHQVQIINNADAVALIRDKTKDSKYGWDIYKSETEMSDSEIAHHFGLPWSDGDKSHETSPKATGVGSKPRGSASSAGITVPRDLDKMSMPELVDLYKRLNDHVITQSRSSAAAKKDEANLRRLTEAMDKLDEVAEAPGSKPAASEKPYKIITKNRRAAVVEYNGERYDVNMGNSGVSGYVTVMDKNRNETTIRGTDFGVNEPLATRGKNREAAVRRALAQAEAGIEAGKSVSPGNGAPKTKQELQVSPWKLIPKANQYVEPDTQKRFVVTDPGTRDEYQHPWKGDPVSTPKGIANINQALLDDVVVEVSPEGSYNRKHGRADLQTLKDFNSQRHSQDKCEFATAAVVLSARRMGLKARKAAINTMPANARSSLGYGHQFPIITVDGKDYVFDYTFAQFGTNRKLPWPLIVPLDEYRKRYREDGFKNGIAQ